MRLCYIEGRGRECSNCFISTASDVVTVLRGHTRTSSPLILADLKAYAICSLLPPMKTNYRLFHRKYEILICDFLPMSASEWYAHRFEITNYIIIHTTLYIEVVSYGLHTQADLLMSLPG